MTHQLHVARDLSGVDVWGDELGADGHATKPSSSPQYDLDAFESTLAASLGAVFHPEDRPRMAEMLTDCFAGKTPMLDAECRFIAKDDSLSWKLVRGIVTRDATGLPLAFMGTAADVTMVKQVQDELERVKNRLNAVTGSKACTWDFELIDGQIASSTPVFTNAWELCGYDPSPSSAGLRSPAAARSFSATCRRRAASIRWAVSRGSPSTPGLGGHTSS